MSVQNPHSQSSLTHVVLSPGTNHQKFRGQQEVRGQATDPMNSCFSATALFFDSFPPTPLTIFFPWPFSSPSPPHLSLCHPVLLCPSTITPSQHCRTYFHLFVSSSPSVRSTYISPFPLPLPFLQLSPTTFFLPDFLFLCKFLIHKEQFSYWKSETVTTFPSLGSD